MRASLFGIVESFGCPLSGGSFFDRCWRGGTQTFFMTLWHQQMGEELIFFRKDDNIEPEIQPQYSHADKKMDF